MIKTNNFDLNEFVNFMEPRFKSAGYRDVEGNRVGGGNILIIHDAGAGDFITQSAAIREIRRLYPDAHITLIANVSAFNLAEHCPYINELIQMHGFIRFLDTFQFNISIASMLLERRFDVCYAFIHYTGTPFLMYMSGARTRIAHVNDGIGVGSSEVPIRYSINLATHLFPTFLYGKHAVDNALSLIDSTLFSPVSNRKIEVWYSPLDYSIASSYIRVADKPVYALCMGGASHRKHYPPEKYARLVEMIINEEPTATFVILGGGQDDLNSAEIFKRTLPEIYHKNILDLTNETTYRQSAAILSFCDLHICNDTGTMHMAAAVGCPVLNPIPFAADLPMFTVSCPSRWCPYGVPSVRVQPEHALPECKAKPGYRGCRAKESHCIAQIEPETLFKGFHLLKEMVEAKLNKTIYAF